RSRFERRRARPALSLMGTCVHQAPAALSALKAHASPGARAAFAPARQAHASSLAGTGRQGLHGADVAAVVGGADQHLVDAPGRRLAGDKDDDRPPALRLQHACIVSGVSGTGRLSRIGVATSPGQSTDERMPFWHSSRLMVWLMATMPCLAAT